MTKLFLMIFLGTLSLGLSSVAKAELFVNWVPAHKGLDCFSSCGKTSLKFPIPTGVDHQTSKPSFFICVTHQRRGGEWRGGFNKWDENSCATTFDGKEFLGTDYYCLCTNNPRFRPFE
ncbi:MAG: hypothetical protein VSS75_021595 [Candidatus Parabeggiatoa sp.]|nr:hypothetical protein [Candidatus Parabeggiatoa sp.]